MKVQVFPDLHLDVMRIKRTTPPPCPDDDALISKILGDLDRIPEPAAAQPEQAPPPIGFAENIRHAVTKDARTRLAYRLLHEHVSRHNPDHEHNVQRLLGLCSSELTKAIILFLAEKDADREFDETDFPFEMIELEPRHWTLQEKSNFEMDLNQMTVRAFGWGLLPPSRASTTLPSSTARRGSHDHHLGHSHPQWWTADACSNRKLEKGLDTSFAMPHEKLLPVLTRADATVHEKVNAGRCELLGKH